MWLDSKDGQFSITTTYSLLSFKEEEFDLNLNTDNFPLVWKWQGPQKVRIFIWKLVDGRLLTIQEHFKRHTIDSEDCAGCLQAPESFMHTLTDCDKVQTFLDLPYQT